LYVVGDTPVKRARRVRRVRRRMPTTMLADLRGRGVVVSTRETKPTPYLNERECLRDVQRARAGRAPRRRGGGRRHRRAVRGDGDEAVEQAHDLQSRWHGG